jgi:hypothetical protein
MLPIKDTSGVDRAGKSQDKAPPETDNMIKIRRAIGVEGIGARER